MSVKSVVGGVLGAFIFVAAPVLARVTQIDVSVVEPFAGGAGFGNTGAYERARGMVEYEADFFLLRPVDAARGNRKIIYDVTNRGRKFIHFRLMDARPPSVAVGNDPKTAEDAGNGLFFRMGYTLAWSGWDSEAPRNANGMAMKPIVATDQGKPIVRVIRDELVSGTRNRADAAQ